MTVLNTSAARKCSEDRMQCLQQCQAHRNKPQLLLLQLQRSSSWYLCLWTISNCRFFELPAAAKEPITRRRDNAMGFCSTELTKQKLDIKQVMAGTRSIARPAWPLQTYSKWLLQCSDRYPGASHAASVTCSCTDTLLDCNSRTAHCCIT